ncbi:MAG: hypothetical protein K6G94_11095 [Kiritimatiellae bacterium]|nr:hypothetical protein [Kiritimatiellia bacterium]
MKYHNRSFRDSVFDASLCIAIFAMATPFSAHADVTLYNNMTISGSSVSDGVYVLTDFAPKSNTVVRAKYASKQNHTGCLFCARKGSSTNPPYFVFLPNVSKKFEFDYGDQKFTATANFVADRAYELEIRNGTASVTDTVSGEIVSLGSGLASFESDKQLALFKTYGNTSYGAWNNAFEGVFYFMETYDIKDGEEVLSHHFVPCTEEGVVKLCDLADGNKTYSLTATGDGCATVNGAPALAVEAGTTVRLTADCTVGNLSGAVGAKLFADGCEVTITGENFYLGGLELATENGGSFVKTGVETAYLYSPGALGASIHVVQGSAVFSEYGLTQKYWRWTFTKVAQSPNPLWLGRLWLFGDDGSHVATNLVRRSDNYASLQPGDVTWKYDASVTNIDIYAGASGTSYGVGYLNRVFNDSLTENMNTFPMLGSPVIDPSNEDSWLSAEFRLRNDDKSTSGYNIMSGACTDSSIGNIEPAKHCPVSWKVEASDDGVAWTEIETRSDVDTSKVTEGGYFYDGEKYTTAALRGKPVEHFRFGGYKRDGLEADAAKALSVQVDDGASLDLTAFTLATQKIDAVTIDLAAGGGTVLGGSIVTGGTLTVLNGTGSNLSGTLPLLFQNTSDTGNFESWNVVVDGHGTSRKIKYRNGRLCFVGGFVLIVR